MQVFKDAKKALKILFGSIRHVQPLSEEEIRELCGSPEMDRLELIKSGRRYLQLLDEKSEDLLDGARLNDFEVVGQVGSVMSSELALSRGLDKLANTTLLRWQVVKLILKERFA